MNYKDYIDLGFKRDDLRDAVLFDETGYYGFYLKYELSDNVSIEINNDYLNKPKLYIQKKDSITCFIIELTEEQLLTIFNKNTPSNGR